MSTPLYQGAYGIPLQFEILRPDGATPHDLTNVTSLVLQVVKPDGTEHTWPLTVVDDPTLGVCQYVLALGDLDQAGHYRLQPRVGTSSSFFPTSPVTLRVPPNPP